MPVCTRKGCGKNFSSDATDADPCQFHPGAPVFHEGLKGWSCCSKRVVDFDEFLRIPGCMTGEHTTEKVSAAPPAATVTAPAATAVETTKNANGEAVETFSTPVSAMSGLDITSAPQRPASVNGKNGASAAGQVVEEPQDPANAQISVGTVCKRKGCGQKYVNDEQSRGDGQCCYHPGAPVFHEGSKGWSCCTRKVLEFDEFLRIKGCRQSRHMFTAARSDSPAAASQNGTAAPPSQYRRDWYQTRDQVIVSVYAKKADKARSSVKFEDQQVRIHLVFNDAAAPEYSAVFDTYMPIRTADSSFEVLSTKLEIILKKSSGISWPSLEPSEADVKDWTTFGSTGSKTGTVGGKEMYLATDAPIYAQR